MRFNETWFRWLIWSWAIVVAPVKMKRAIHIETVAQRLSSVSFDFSMDSSYNGNNLSKLSSLHVIPSLFSDIDMD